MEAFWCKGYEATSLNDLMSATGLHKGSLYQAFGDKHSLFLAALKRYLDNMRRQKNELLKQARTPVEGLRNVAHGMIDMADGDSECPKGCMAINALVEMAPHDPDVQQIMSDHIARIRSSVETAVSQGQGSGQIRSKLSPEVITSLITTFIAGLGATMKGPLSKAQAHKLLDAQFDVILGVGSE